MQLFDDSLNAPAHDWVARRSDVLEHPIALQPGLNAYRLSEGKKLSAKLVSFDPNVRLDKHFFQHKAEEFIYVIKGEIIVEADGRQERLGSGDSLNLTKFFPSMWQTGSLETEILVVWSE